MDIWIIGGVAGILLVVIYAVYGFLDTIKMRKQRKNSEMCENSGHIWDSTNCICKRCGYERHDWIHRGEEIYCTKCGKIK